MKNKGFTILEILVVISVIAILIGIAIPRFKGMQDAANAIKVKSELKTLQSAMEMYKSKNKVYATTLAQLIDPALGMIAPTATNPLGDAYYPVVSPSGDYYAILAPNGTGKTALVLSNTGTMETSGSTLDFYCISNGTLLCLP